MVGGREAESFPERKCKSRSKTVVLLYFVFKGKKTLTKIQNCSHYFAMDGKTSLN